MEVIRAWPKRSLMEDSDDDVPLVFKRRRTSSRQIQCNTMYTGLDPAMTLTMADKVEASIKAHGDSDSDDDVPLSARVKSRFGKSTKIPQNYNLASSLSIPMQEDLDDEKPLSSKLKKGITGASSNKKVSAVLNKRPKSNISLQSTVKKPKRSAESTLNYYRKEPVKAESKIKEVKDCIPISDSSVTKPSVHKKVNDGVVSPVVNSPRKQKWTSLVHNGVMFPPSYQPHGVKILYKKKPVYLTPEQEEVATFYAVMLGSDHMKSDVFKCNFFHDWKILLGEDHVIQNLEDCDFTPICEWHQAKEEKKKQMSSEEKKARQEEKMKEEEKYMWAIVDGVKEKVGNFRIEPPGLFKGRGENPQLGKLKKRILPSDVTINIGKGAPIPECPVPGERWKEIIHDDTVSSLAFWKDPIFMNRKYVYLDASSTQKGRSDMEKYDKASKLTDYIDKIRKTYTKNFTSEDATKCQIAVATYLIDKLALRAGNEKDEDEADTVGCCTLKVENVEPQPPNMLKFDFLGKDSIRYENVVEVELPAFEAIQKFRKGKRGGDDLFDMLDTSKLNAHLKELMPGLTAKVFRTYNASRTMDDMLTAQTNSKDVAENIVVYQRANKEVAIICNHQRSVSKSHGQQIERLDEKMKELNDDLEELKVDFDRAKRGKPPLKGADGKTKRNLTPEAIEKKIAKIHARIEKMESEKTTKEDLKTVALGTSKTNYLDPRITVAWCKRHEIPIEKIFNKSLLKKFSWAMDVHPSFRFSNVCCGDGCYAD